MMVPSSCNKYLYMPFKSEKQKRWMYANKPEIAEDWSKSYKKGYIPESLSPNKSRKKSN